MSAPWRQRNAQRLRLQGDRYRSTGVRAAKDGLREPYGTGHRIPDAPSSEQVLVALAKELSDVEFATSSE